MKDIKSGRIQLPDFQRNWVWDDTYVQRLLASISLAYPIGAVDARTRQPAATI